MDETVLLGSQDLSVAQELTRNNRELLKLTRDEAIDFARTARSNGVHYGGYQVGVSALCRKGTHYQFLTGHNYKPVAGGKDRRCGEIDILKQAARLEYDEVLFFVIFAAPKSDDLSGLNLDVLITCGYCRRHMLKKIRQRVRTPAIPLYLPILSVNADTGRSRVFILRNLLQRCGELV